MKLIGLILAALLVLPASAFSIEVGENNLTSWQELNSNIQIGDVIEIGCIYPSYQGQEVKPKGW